MKNIRIWVCNLVNEWPWPTSIWRQVQFSPVIFDNELKIVNQGCRNREDKGGRSPPDFDRTVNSNSTSGADYAHHNTTRPLSPGFSDLPTALQWFSFLLFFSGKNSF